MTSLHPDAPTTFDAVWAQSIGAKIEFTPDWNSKIVLTGDFSMIDSEGAIAVVDDATDAVEWILPAQIVKITYGE